MRLIDADALVKHCNGNPFITDSVKSYVQISVATMPTIEERKTGKWIKKPEFCGDDASGFIDNHFSCSECKKEAEINSWGFYILSDFCPYCGARLVQEGEDNDS